MGRRIRRTNRKNSKRLNFIRKTIKRKYMKHKSMKRKYMKHNSMKGGSQLLPGDYAVIDKSVEEDMAIVGNTTS